jgi:hypothetical protein
MRTHARQRGPNFWRFSASSRSRSEALRERSKHSMVLPDGTPRRSTRVRQRSAELECWRPGNDPPRREVPHPSHRCRPPGRADRVDSGARPKPPLGGASATLHRRWASSSTVTLISGAIPASPHGRGPRARASLWTSTSSSGIRARCRPSSPRTPRQRKLCGSQ